ncbi:glycosyltransferase family 9 protein [Methylococcus geothermalis]|uniref:Glycosyltransferase family 9 protein n=1 Tax=Methylococcus geothermalis TaxID=2681310 RepID=A0A858QB24_9GAMM|nr:glycosyltransferase family 9 protein [Methylococcus geothermalis]QJD30981.1 glycosyltransferase family 9 protein [Methylococcus geothermalis]
MTEHPGSILIIRLGAIGDIVFASALIPVLRQAFPDARLVWLADEAYKDMLIHNPRLDRVATWPRAHWARLRKDGHYGILLKACRNLVRSLRDERFDWVLDLQGLMKSGVWAALAGGKTRIGLGSREGSQYLMNRCIDRRTESYVIGSEYLKLAGELGLDTTAFAMDFVPGDEAMAEAGTVLDSLGIAGPYAAIFPFTTRPQKHWIDDNWSALADEISSRYGWPVVMLGGPGDTERAAGIRSRCRSDLKNLAGKTGLAVSGALIQRSALGIGVDTGLTHMSIALGCPTLALFGSTAPYLETGRNDAIVLYEALPCSPCERHPTCDGAFPCMAQLTIEKTLAAVDALLKRA